MESAREAEGVVMRYELRDYQETAVRQSVDWLKVASKGAGLAVLPTGSGKSLVIASIIDRLDGPCLVFQPSKEILAQNAAKLVSYGYRPRIFSASLGRRQVGEITLATIGSVVKHPEAFDGVRYILIDECHAVNALGGMYAEFLEKLSGAKVLGLTASPYRLHTNSLGSELRFLTRTRPRIFARLVHLTQVPDLFAAGYLAPIEWRRVDAIDRRRLKLNTTRADWTDDSVKREVRSDSFLEGLERETTRLLDLGRRSVVVFTRFTGEADRLAGRLGDDAALVTAKTAPKERDRILHDFKAGRIRVVANVGIISIGFDFPALEAVVLGRPTASLALYYQQAGRGIRPAPGKTRVDVVDLVGVSDIFGKVETMEIRGEGKKGDLWAVWNNGRQLTNRPIEELVDDAKSARPKESPAPARRSQRRTIRAAFKGQCPSCRQEIAIGEEIVRGKSGRWGHAACA